MHPLEDALHLSTIGKKSISIKIFRTTSERKGASGCYRTGDTAEVET